MITTSMLERQLRRLLGQPLELRLYIGIGDAENEVFEEPAGGGYRAVSLTLNDWTITQIPEVVGETETKDFRFDGTKRFRVLGSFITQSDGPIVARMFDTPIEVGRRGDIIPVRAVMHAIKIL